MGFGSLVRLAVWGGHAGCGRCGSNKVRRGWSPLASWTSALGLDPCRCETCGATFHAPRRAATIDDYEDNLEMLAVPPPPEVDLAELDRAIAERLKPHDPSAQ